MCIENVKQYVSNTGQIGKAYLPLKKTSTNKETTTCFWVK